jgi:hypothetical protein
VRVRAVSLLALLLVGFAAACGDDEETTTPARDATTVAACWEDAAVTAKRAADGARAVLPGEVVRARRQYASLRDAAARGDARAFTDARTDFFRALARIKVGREEFEKEQKRAGAALTACSNDNATGEAVAACWRSVASTYEESLLAADGAFGPLAGTLFFTVQRLVDAVEGGEGDAVQRAEARFLSALLRVQQAAERYAASRERGGDLYAQCANG